MSKDEFKRFFDYCVSFSLICLFLPLFLFLWILIRKKIGNPVFFVQKRPGLKGKTFNLVKFRTMSEERDQHGNLLPDKDRLSKFGIFLRASSLDELPELWNVLKGDMSLVGPRPLLMEYLSLYNSEQMKRHDSKPGITGLAQVNGRNSISWDEKFRLDGWYVENQTFLLDIHILLGTFNKVIKKDGITAEGEATMPKFEGNKDV